METVILGSISVVLRVKFWDKHPIVLKSKSALIC